MDIRSQRHSLIEKREFVDKKYEKAIEAVDLDGNFQQTAFYILATTAFICSLILTAFPLQKEVPSYECINKFDFADLEEYNMYKNSSRYKIVHMEECIDKFCKNKVEDYQDPLLWVLIADLNSLTNMITNLDVLCHIDNFSSDFTRMLFSGRIVGTLLFAYISDNLGRHIAFSLGLTMLFICNLSFFFLRYTVTYYITAFFVNMTFQLYSLITIVSVEIMSNNLYSVLNGVIGSLFAFCGLFNLIIMYFFKDWFVLLGIHLVVDFIIVYLNFTRLTETPKFCLMKKDYNQLERILIRISKENGTYDIVKLKLQEIQELKKSVKKDSITSDNVKNVGLFSYINPIRFISTLFGPYVKILTARNDLGNFIKFIIPYITIFFVYYGQLMFVEKLPGDVQLNSLLIFTSELFSPNLAGYLLTKTSRKLILSIFHIICIICSLLFTQISNPIILSILLFTNCFSICVNLVVTYVFTAEVFDSSIKTSAMSVLLLIANLSLVFGDLLMNVFPSPFYMFALMCASTIFSISSIKENYENKSNTITH
jgi:MFS family permease